MKKFLKLLGKAVKLWNTSITMKEVKELFDKLDKNNDEKLQVIDVLILVAEEVETRWGINK